MKEQKRSYGCGFILLFFAAAFILSGCATSFEQKQPTPYVSPIQEIIYGKTLGFKESASTKDTEPLGNTRWRITNVRPSVVNLFKGTEFSFERNGILVESAELPNGTIYTDTHRYRIAGSALVLTKDGHTAVALFKVEGNTLNIDADDYSLTLERVSK
jgi:hypothetical protein